MCSPKKIPPKIFRRNGVCASKNTLKNPPQSIFKKGGVSKNSHAIGFLRPPPLIFTVLPMKKRKNKPLKRQEKLPVTTFGSVHSHCLWGL